MQPTHPSIPLCDIGANLADPIFADDLEAVLQRAIDANVQAICLTGSDLESNEQVMRMTTQQRQATSQNEEHSAPFLTCTAGIHPHHAKDWNSDTEAMIMACADNLRCVAWGEMGLDFNRNFSTPAQQESVFARQLAFAAADAKKRPCFLHTRDAFDSFHAILKEHRDHLHNPLVHCFTGTKDDLYSYLDLDCWIGFTGWLCDSKRGKHLRMLVPHIPLHRLVIETDAPWLLPRDLSEKQFVTQERNAQNRRRNEPCYLPHIAQTIAALRPEDDAVVLQQLWDNSQQWMQIS